MTSRREMVDSEALSKLDQRYKTVNEVEEEDEEDTRIPPPPPNSPWKAYFSTYNLTILISRNKLIYGTSLTIWYLV